MNRKLSSALLILAAGLQTYAPASSAKGTTDEIARLGKDLTCTGAEKAGNKDKTIPEFSGKWQGVPPHVNFKGTGHHPIDPYPDEKPLFVISATNMAQYAGRLSEGQKALFKKYPDTFQMPIYPSHRDFSPSNLVCENAKKNAASTELVNNGLGVTGGTGVPLFPFPKSGLELLWNTIVSNRAYSEELISDNAYVLPNGSVNWGRVKSRNMSPPSELGVSHKNENQSSYYLNETLLPARDKGEINTGMEFFNFKNDPRQSWRFDPGTRRVRQSPGYGYDMSFPGTGGSITVDEVRIWNGSPERYDWNIAGKQEIYIPYNATRVHSPTIKYSELMTPHHANPKSMRYELHRVWVLEGKLKNDFRHVYAKRVLYVDEDSLMPVMGDNYDSRGGLWRTSMLNYFYAYEAQLWEAGTGFYHDLVAGSYLGFNLINEQPTAYKLNEGKLTPQMFGPEAARRMGL